MYEKFKKLLDERGISAYKFCKDTKIGQSTITDWKMGRHVPSMEKFLTMAEYFGVPLSYFQEEHNYFEGHDKDFDERMKYYNDKHVAKMIDDINSRPGMKMLFDASKDLSEDDISLVLDLVNRLKGNI